MVSCIMCQLRDFEHHKEMQFHASRIAGIMGGVSFPVLHLFSAVFSTLVFTCMFGVSLQVFYSTG